MPSLQKIIHSEAPNESLYVRARVLDSKVFDQGNSLHVKFEQGTYRLGPYCCKNLFELNKHAADYPILFKAIKEKRMKLISIITPDEEAEIRKQQG